MNRVSALYNEWMKQIIFLSILFISGWVHAEVKFNCYALNYGVQAYEAGRVNCGSKESIELKDSPATTVTCVYQSICEALAPGEQPTVLTPSEITNMMLENSIWKTNFKMSAISCRGEGTILKGSLTNVSCKAPKDCQDDVLYNAMTSYNVGVHENSQVEAPNMTKPVGVKK